MPIADRIKSAWNAFVFGEKNALEIDYGGGGAVSGSSYLGGVSPSRPRLRVYSERSIIGSLYNRLAIDVASVDFRHVRVDDQNRYAEDVDSDLNRCLTIEANLDQGPRDFRQDIALSMFDQGCVALVPVDTTRDPNTNALFDIQTMRVGEIVQFYPQAIRVRVYNEMTGNREEVTLDKRYVAIVYNPLHAVMNEPSSTLQRLIRKLSLLDGVDEATASGKLDIIIQMPYSIKSDSRRKQAEQKRDDLEFQLKGSEYGVAYADAADKIIQLNRPAENNLLKQIEYLTKTLYEQLGLTEAVMNGTADEAAMKNYQTRTIEPIVDAIKEAMQRSFIAKKDERILYFMDALKLVPVKDLAEIADKFTRNEILSSNEIRGIIGFKPSTDPKADELVNSNMPETGVNVNVGTDPGAEDDDFVNEALDGVDSMLSEIENDLGGLGV